VREALVLSGEGGSAGAARADEPTPSRCMESDSGNVCVASPLLPSRRKQQSEARFPAIAPLMARITSAVPLLAMSRV